MSADRYGKYYWCAKVPPAVSKSREIYLHADKVTVDGGVASFWGDDGLLVLSLAPGNWVAVYAASCLDGAAVAVDRWEGEVNDRS